MARYFSEQEIDDFRDCFYLRCKSGVMSEVEDLKFVMRSVGLSPTMAELRKYMKQKENKISFADFLDVAHSHLKVERIPHEILKAFESHSKPSSPASTANAISVLELQRLLCSWGEKLSSVEYQNLLVDLKATRASEISHKKIVDTLIIPRV